MVTTQKDINEYSVFDRIAIDWYVRIKAIPWLEEYKAQLESTDTPIDINSESTTITALSRRELLGLAKTPKTWRDAARHLKTYKLPRSHSVDDSPANSAKLIAEVRRNTSLSVFDENTEQLVAAISEDLCRNLVHADEVMYTSDKEARTAALLRNAIGSLLAKTHEDETITSGIVADVNKTATPVGVWPRVLERAWKTKYCIKNRGNDAVYHLLRNAPALQRAMIHSK